MVKVTLFLSGSVRRPVTSS